jgi:hypothetical protein
MAKHTVTASKWPRDVHLAQGQEIADCLACDGAVMIAEEPEGRCDGCGRHYRVGFIVQLKEVPMAPEAS